MILWASHAKYAHCLLLFTYDVKNAEDFLEFQSLKVRFMAQDFTTETHKEDVNNLYWNRNLSILGTE